MSSLAVCFRKPTRGIRLPGTWASVRTTILRCWRESAVNAPGRSRLCPRKWKGGHRPIAECVGSVREEVIEIMDRLPHRPLLAGEQGLRLSLAGAQVKLPVVIDSTSGGATRLALPLGDTPSTHIIKPEPLRFPGLAENEAWCMALARRIGMDAAEAWAEANWQCAMSDQQTIRPGARGVRRDRPASASGGFLPSPGLSIITQIPAGRRAVAARVLSDDP